MTLPAAGQAAGCADSLTQLPPPFDLQAPVAALPAGASLAALSPLTTIIAAAAAQQAQQAAAAPSPVAAASRRLLADAPAPAPGQLQQPVFGITAGGSAAGTSYGDPLAAALTGDQDAYNLLSKNQVRVWLCVRVCAFVCTCVCKGSGQGRGHATLPCRAAAAAAACLAWSVNCCGARGCLCHASGCTEPHPGWWRRHTRLLRSSPHPLMHLHALLALKSRRS